MAPWQPVSFLATAEPEQAKLFYCEILGLKLLEASPYALVLDDCGHSLRVQIVSELIPLAHTMHGWQVTGLEQQIAALVAKGVMFEVFDQLGQDALGIWTSPDGHKIAWFKDPCGNVLSLTEHAQPS